MKMITPSPHLHLGASGWGKPRHLGFLSRSVCAFGGREAGRVVGPLEVGGG